MTGWSGHLLGVYGPNRDSHRRRLWKELAEVMSLWDVPWCIGGILMSLFFKVRGREELEGGVR